MKIIDNIKEKIKPNEDEKKFSLSPEIRSYYDSLKPEFYDAIIKSLSTVVKDNNIFIRYLKVKLQENKSCADFYITSRYEDLLKREILDREYVNNTSKQVIEYVKYKKKKHNEERKLKKVKKGDIDGKESNTSN